MSSAKPPLASVLIPIVPANRRAKTVVLHICRTRTLVRRCDAAVPSLGQCPAFPFAGGGLARVGGEEVALCGLHLARAGLSQADVEAAGAS